MNDTERTARLRDRIAIDQITIDHPALPASFTGPDRASFFFLDNVMPEVNRERVAAARRIFGEAFGAVFGPRDVWSSNGTRRQYIAELASGLKIVLTARACDMPQDEDGAEVRELEAVAA